MPDTHAPQLEPWQWADAHWRKLVEQVRAGKSYRPKAWKGENDFKLLYDDNIRTLLRVGDETRVKKQVIQLSYAPYPLLISLIRGAKATVFPSLYEGFGLPLLESMLLGTPVISSTASSIPEVAGDAALLVDPYDARQISDAIRIALRP